MNDGLIAQLSELIALKRYASPVAFSRENHALQQGNHLSHRRGRGMDFAEVRHYQAGDDIRHMEWRMTARTGRPHIKLYQEERERPLVLLAEFNPSMYFGTRIALKSVIAAHLAALIGWIGIEQGDRVGGFIYSPNRHHEFSPRARDTHFLPLLASLSDYTEQKPPLDSPPRPLSEALIQLRRVTKPGSFIVLIGDFYHFDEQSVAHLSRLSHQNQIMLYHILDPLECSPPKPGQYQITNGHQTHLLDLMNPDILVHYETMVNERINPIKQHCKTLNIHYVQVQTTSDLPQLVRQTFPRRLR